MSRRRFLGGVSLAAAGTFGYAHYFEAERLEKTYPTIPLSNGDKPPIKLLHLSDFHASPVVDLEYIHRAIQLAVEWHPDLICVTGDFITQKFDEAAAYVDVLRHLSSAAPTFASLGNHDGGRWASEDGGYADLGWIESVLAASGIELLRNRAATIGVGGREFNVVGCGDLWAGDFEAPRAFAKRNNSETILLSHNPDTKEHLGIFDWNLMLSGHTHGGQLRVPWIGATPFAPVKDKRFVSGLHQWKDRWIHVTKGIGSVFGVRINCPPELSFLTLT